MKYIIDIIMVLVMAAGMMFGLAGVSTYNMTLITISIISEATVIIYANIFGEEP